MNDWGTLMLRGNALRLLEVRKYTVHNTYLLVSLAIWSYATPITNYCRSHASPPKAQSVVRTHNETIFYLAETLHGYVYSTNVIG